jgi:type IV pilus assembly protein PilC
MKFDYQGRTKEGDIKVGQVEASSEDAAINLLQKYGFYVTYLKEAKAPIYAKKIKLFEHVSRKDVVMFSRQLSIMFRSKVSLVEALRVLAAQMKADFKEKIFHISEEVEAGTSFSKALAKYPKIFSPFFISMVESGEASGKLAEVLNYLAEHLEKEYHLNSKVKGAMVYPGFVLTIVIAVIFLMIYLVIPNLSQTLLSSGGELPVITKFVLAGSAFLKTWGWTFLLLVIFMVIFISRYSATEIGKRNIDKYVLKLPLVGGLAKMIYVSRFAENLSTLVSGGLPITQAIEITANVIGNISFKEAILESREGVKKGEPISSILSKYTNLFPPVFVQMVLVGEKTGSLDSVLMNVTGFYEKEIERTIDSLLGVLEPLMITFLGLIVGGMMFSILTPMYQMMSV